jgi:hypothetical protein
MLFASVDESGSVKVCGCRPHDGGAACTGAQRIQTETVSILLVKIITASQIVGFSSSCGISPFESLAVRMASCCIFGPGCPILSEGCGPAHPRTGRPVTLSPAAAPYRASGLVH